MNRVFKFALTKEEYIEFLCWQYGLGRKGIRFFLITSVPTILITGTILLFVKHIINAKNWYAIIVVIALSVLWVLYGASKLWNKYLRISVNDKIIKKMNIQNFKEIRYQFDNEGLSFVDKGREIRLSYKELTLMPLQNLFAFCHKEGAVLLPYRVFNGKDDIKQFLVNYEKLSVQ